MSVAESRTRPMLAAGLGALAAMCAGAAHAQSSTTGSSFNSGYGLASGQIEKGVNVSMRNAQGNTVILDGVIQAGTDGSIFASRQTTGAGDAYSGAANVGGTAIGNNLQVTVTGSYNTVVVNSTQTNTAPVTATTVLNGQVQLDGN